MNIDFGQLLDICKAYNDMGWSVQGQLRAIANGESLDEQNCNALRMIRGKFLVLCVNDDGDTDEEIVDLIDQIDEHLNESGEVE